jgi:glucose 1-dehydrogenase
MQRRLEGQAALVTGASSGIGQSIATRLGWEGASVGVNHLSNEDKVGAETAVRQIEEAGANAVAIEGDVSSEDDATRMVREVAEEFGRLDVLVNNAGVESERPFLEMTLADWEKVLSVNLTGAFLMSREALKVMVENGGGKIINISSVHERIPWPGFAHYAASKGGLKMFTETLALEFAKRGVRVNALAPGAIATSINKEKLETPGKRAEVEKLIPWDRWGEPEEVAACAAFLASEEASYVTGATLFVDGGMALYPGFEEGGG